jgi:hypothetical protein
MKMRLSGNMSLAHKLPFHVLLLFFLLRVALLYLGYSFGVFGTADSAVLLSVGNSFGVFGDADSGEERSKILIFSRALECACYLQVLILAFLLVWILL